MELQDFSATPATTIEFERLLRDFCETWKLVITGLDGALAHDSGQALRDNPHPQGTSNRLMWLVGWLPRRGSCDRAGSVSMPAQNMPNQDDGATSGRDPHVP
jgi:hypothetical protein